MAGLRVEGRGILVAEVHARLLAVTVALFGCTSTPPAPAAELAPDFDEATANPTECGLERIALSRQLQTRRAVVLNFGASYCEPCLYELPEYQRLAERFHGEDVLMVFVLLDEDPANVKAMLDFLRDDLGVRFPVVSDPTGRLAARFRVDNLPYLVLVDGQRQIAWSEQGFRPNTLDELERRLAALTQKVF